MTWNSRPLIRELPTEQRRVLEALIRSWLQDTAPGRQCVETIGSEDEALRSVCELSDKGLVEFVTDRSRPRTVGFSVKPVSRAKP